MADFQLLALDVSVPEVRAPAAGNRYLALLPIAIQLGTITANNPLRDDTVSLNNSGVAFTLNKTNIVSDVSAAATKFFDYQLAGTSKFWLRKDGALYVTKLIFELSFESGLSSVNNYDVQYTYGGGQRVLFGNNYCRVSNGAMFQSSTDTGFHRKAAKVWEFNDGTANSYAGTAYGSGSQAVAQLTPAATAGNGARSCVTDSTLALAGNAGTAVAGGGANHVPVIVLNGVWCIG
jgi:hypothetical protein